MKAHVASGLNAAILILAGIWGYIANDAKSLTALIPVAFGFAILACYPGVKSENKVVAHIAVVLTLVILLALIMPLRSQIEDGMAMGLLRILLMMASCIFAKVYFIKSFRDARRARTEGA